MTADDFAYHLAQKGYRVKREAGGWRGQCPAHGGKDTNMTIRPHPTEGGVVTTCHSHHCDRAAIAKAVGLTMDALTNGNGKQPPPERGRETVYVYREEQGQPLFEVVREGDGATKKIWQRLPGATKGGIGDVRRVLFRLPELLQTEPGQVVAITEGEKCALAVAERGIAATTNPHGSRKWRQEFTDWLKQHLPDRSFVIFPDNDGEGIKHAEEVFLSLKGAGLKCRVALIEGLPAKGDIYDWLKTHSTEELLELVTPARSHAKGEIDAADLLGKAFAPLRWAIEGVLPEGLAVFAGPSKSCKSWLCCEIGIASVSGGRVFGELETPRGDCLYLALEDSERRLQDRLRTLLRGASLPRGLTLKCDAPRIGEGCEEYIADWLERHQSARLVIIDVLQKIRPPKRPGVSEYEQDYETLTALQKLCRDYRVAMLMVHHTRKAKADDPYDMISGSTAIQGASDTLMALMRVRGEPDATLHYTGRDVDSKALALQWDQQDCGWRLIGDAKDHMLSAERTRIVEFLCSLNMEVGPSEIAGALGLNPGAVRVLLSKMAIDGQITKTAYGKYSVTFTQKMSRKNGVTSVSSITSDSDTEPVALDNAVAPVAPVALDCTSDYEPGSEG